MILRGRHEAIRVHHRSGRTRAARGRAGATGEARPHHAACRGHVARTAHHRRCSTARRPPTRPLWCRRPTSDVVAMASDHTGVALRRRSDHLPARPRADRARPRHRLHGAGRLSGRRRSRWRDQSHVAKPTPASSSTAPASGRRSRPTRSTASGRSMALTETIARYSREHNGANVLTLGATLLSVDEAKAIVTTWISTADARAALHPAADEDPRPRTTELT